MQVGPGTDGIQKLLAAETDAQRIVADARKGACSMTGAVALLIEQQGLTLSSGHRACGWLGMQRNKTG